MFVITIEIPRDYRRYERYLSTFILEEEDNKELKKNDIKGKDNFGFVIFDFCRKAILVFF